MFNVDEWGMNNDHLGMEFTNHKNGDDLGMVYYMEINGTLLVDVDLIN